MPPVELAPLDPIAIYLKDIASIPLLQREEEIELSQQIEIGRRATNLIARLRPHATKKRTLLEAEIEAGRTARELLTTANTHLVVSMAKKYRGRGVPFLDLIQEGNLGLMKAVERFDHRRGYKFSTYATWWIRQKLSRAIPNQGRTIRHPVHLADTISRVTKAARRLIQDLGREPTPEEISRESGLSPPRVRLALVQARDLLSLESPINANTGLTLADLLEDDTTPSPEAAAVSQALAADLDQALDHLPPRQALVLSLRYLSPSAAEPPLSRKVIGKRLGVTHERTRQIESDAD